MKYLHQHEDFKFFINKAAKEVNLSEFIIEKDYWVTYLLKNLVRSEFNNEFVFKGGTCLSKAYNLINRFSEDIDLLMLETENTKSKTQKGKRLSALREFVSNLSGITCTESNRSELYATYKFAFPSYSFSIISSVSKEILLEPGYRGGIAPEIRKKAISSYVENLLYGKIENYDVEPFEINVLSLERIFMEKVFAIKEIYDKDNGQTLLKKTRHYYDIYKLAQTDEIKTLLNDKKRIDAIVEDINTISHKYYNLAPVTWDELVNHIALKPDKTLFEQLKQGYTNDKDLYNEFIEFDKLIDLF